MKFGDTDLKQLVECSKRALSAENDYLEQCFKLCHWKNSEYGPGICDNPNERYYQFVIWRELMSSFPWRPRTERQGRDLVFYEDETDEVVAFAEIKCWWSIYGEQELPGIKRDIAEKLGSPTIPGVMLILTSQLIKDAKRNFSWLADKLGVCRSDMVTASFPVSPGLGDESAWEFAVIGFLVTPQSLPASA